MASPTSCDLHHIVQSWVQKVNSHADPDREPPLLPKTARRATASGMRLRDRPTQKTLAEVSINIHTRKRKHAEATADLGNVRDRNNAQQAQRKRGRPAKPKNKALAAKDNGGYQKPDPIPAPPPPTSIPSLPPLSRSSARSPSRSPSRSPTKNFSMARPQEPIEMKFLESCTPPVFRNTFKQLRAEGKDAYDKDFDTPRKSKEPGEKLDYLESSQTPFSAKQCARLMETLEMVLLKAERNARLEAHERQWGAVVSQILDEVELWSNGKVALFNIENCPIVPDRLKLLRPKSGRYINEELQSTSIKPDTTENISRMVDWSFGLELGFDDKRLINEAYKWCDDYEHSLNQTLSYVYNYPLFLDIKIKKAYASRDPEVQLATWAAAGILKRRHHGWNSIMIPTLAIVVDGHEWYNHIFFELAGEIIMTPAARFGDTRDNNGIWTIFHRLANVLTWAQTDYAQWVQDAIVGWAKKKIQEYT
ncbi:MAG: hypothetical protein Q9223_002033 [Gallowayella weberi]